MSNALLVLVSIWIFANTASCRKHIRGTENKAVLLYKQTELVCTLYPLNVVRHVDWYHEYTLIYHCTNTHGCNVTNGLKLLYKATLSGSTTRLYFKTASLDYAGRYRCRVTAPALVNGYYNIIILASRRFHCNIVSPFLAHAEENRAVEYTCDLVYRGFYKPSMRFWFGNRTLSVSSRDRSNVIGYQCVAKLNRYEQGGSFRSQAHFGPPLNLRQGDPTNVPRFQFMPYEGLTTTIEYPVESITITPLRNHYLVNSNLTCSAQGRPAPHSYTWIETNSLSNEKRNMRGNVIQVSGTKGYFEYTCTVANIVLGVLRETQTSTGLVEVYDEETTSFIPDTTKMLTSASLLLTTTVDRSTEDFTSDGATSPTVTNESISLMSTSHVEVYSTEPSHIRNVIQCSYHGTNWLVLMPYFLVLLVVNTLVVVIVLRTRKVLSVMQSALAKVPFSGNQST